MIQVDSGNQIRVYYPGKLSPDQIFNSSIARETIESRFGKERIFDIELPEILQIPPTEVKQILLFNSKE